MFLFGATKGTGQKLSIYSLRPCVLLCMLLLPLGQFRVRGEFEEVPAYKSLKPFFVQSISKPSSLLLPPPPPHPHPHPHPHHHHHHHHHHHQRCFIFFLSFCSFFRSSVSSSCSSFFHLHLSPCPYHCLCFLFESQLRSRRILMRRSWQE